MGPRGDLHLCVPPHILMRGLSLYLALCGRFFADVRYREPERSVGPVIPAWCIVLAAYSQHTATFPACWAHSYASIVLYRRSVAAVCDWVGGMAVPQAPLLLLPPNAGLHTQALSAATEQQSTTIPTFSIDREAG